MFYVLSEFSEIKRWRILFQHKVMLVRCNENENVSAACDPQLIRQHECMRKACPRLTDIISTTDVVWKRETGRQ